MKLDQPWCTRCTIKLIINLLVLCKQEVTTPKRHTDIIRDKMCTCLLARVSVCIICVYVRMYVSTDVYERVNDSMASNNIIITQLINSEVRNIARQNKKDINTTSRADRVWACACECSKRTAISQWITKSKQLINQYINDNIMREC